MGVKQLQSKSWISALLAALIGVMPVHATGGKAVEMRDGPGKDARTLEPFWIMRCNNDTRLVGLRVHADNRIAGVEAICAGLDRDARTEAVSWLGKPRLWIAPPIPVAPKPVVVEAPRSEGTILRAESGTVMRYKGSRALVISVPRAPEPVPQATPGETPVYLLPFQNTRKSEDLVCPRNQFVLGLRTGTSKRELAAIQIICGDGSASTSETVGDWPQAKKGTAVAVTRIQCDGATANPLDGDFADAIFGTIDDGRIQSLGLTCTPDNSAG